MILYSSEARESWKQLSGKMTAKISEIPGNVLSFNDACTVSRLLSMLNEYIDAEDRLVHAANMERSRPRVIVEVSGGMVQNVYADRKVDVDVLDYDVYNDFNCDEEQADAIEDMICEASLLKKVW